MRASVIVCIVVASWGVACAPSSGAREDAWARGDMPGPFESTGSSPVIEVQAGDVWGDAEREREQRSGMMELAFSIYRDHITKVDGPRCEHRPTCSRYAIEAMRRHGFVVGSLMGVDRLLRTGRSSSLRSLPLLRVIDGQPYYSDPVEENDFFF